MAYYKQDMLSIRTRQLLADYLADLTLIVDSVESYRLSLAEIEGFDGVALFRFLDQQQKGYLNVSNIQTVIGQDCHKLLHYAFSWLDVSKVGEITRLEFLDYVLPRQNQQLRNVISVRMATSSVENPHIVNYTLPMQVDLLKSLLLQIMKKQTKLIPLRRELMSQEDYSIKAVLNSLDNSGKGWVNVEDLFKFLKNYDVDVTIHHMKELLGNYDADINGKISFKELAWIIQGLQNRESAYRNIMRNSNRNSINRISTNKKSMRISEKNRNIQVHENVNQEKYIQNSNSKKIQKKTTTAVKQSKNNKTEKNKTEKNKTEKNKKVNSSSQRNKNKIKQFSENNDEKSDITMQNLEIAQKLNEFDKSTFSFNIFSIKQELALLEKKEKEVDTELIKYDLELEEKNREALLRQLEKVKLEKEFRRNVIEREQAELSRMRNQKEKQLRVQMIREEERLIRLQRQEEEAYERDLLLKKEHYKILEERKIQEIQRQQIVEERIRASMIAQHQRNYQQQLKQREMMEKQRLREQTLSIQFQRQRQEERMLRHKILQQNYEAQRDKYLRENQYFWKYNNHINYIQSDPLGIQAHIAETDKYLQKSKQLRKQIEMEKITKQLSYSKKQLQYKEEEEERQTYLIYNSPDRKRQNGNITGTKMKSTQTKLGSGL